MSIGIGDEANTMPEVRLRMADQEQVGVGNVSELPVQNPKQITREVLERLYWQEKKTQQTISDETGLSPYQIHYWMVKLRIPRRSRNEHQFIKVNIKPSVDLAYILGVIKGDGCVIIGARGGYVKLMQTRGEFAQSFENALKNIGFHPHTYCYPNEVLFDTKASSILFARWYKQLSLGDIEKILCDNPEFAKSFIRGFYESEGSSIVYKKMKHCKHFGWVIEMSNRNSELASLVHRLLKSLGFDFKLHCYFDSRYQKEDYRLRSYNYMQNLRFIHEISPCIKNRIKETAPKIFEKWDREKVINEVKKFVLTQGNASIAKRNIKLYGAIQRYIGTINLAKKEAGIEIPYRRGEF